MVLPGFPGKVRNVKSVSKYGHLIMRFQQWGCKNRPFYHIVVDKVKHNWGLYHWGIIKNHFFQESVPNRRQIGYVEQVGTYDMMTNSNNEKLIALNLERIQTYIAGGVQVSTRTNKRYYRQMNNTRIESPLSLLSFVGCTNSFLLPFKLLGKKLAKKVEKLLKLYRI